MKKIMIAVAIVCAAAFTQAAEYSWSIGFMASPDGVNPLEATVYGFDANKYSYATIASALSTTGADALGYALNSNPIDPEGSAYVAGTGLTDDGQTPAYASMYAIIVGEAGGKQYFYGYADFDPVKITDAVIASGANFSTEYIETGAIGGSGWTEVASVPEPTSGLLLLLGVAGLALRRRRA